MANELGSGRYFDLPDDPHADEHMPDCDRLDGCTDTECEKCGKWRKQCHIENVNVVISATDASIVRPCTIPHTPSGLLSHRTAELCHTCRGIECKECVK